MKNLNMLDFVMEPSFKITLKDLQKYCRSNWSSISKLGNPGNSPKAAAKLGYDIYSRSNCKSMDMMIIGPNRIRQNKVFIENFGCVIGNLSQKKIKKLENYQYEGGILGEKQWSAFINDLYMLGGVHARKCFYFSNEMGRPLKDQDVWDSKKGCINTTGRELLLLKLANYYSITNEYDTDFSIFGHVFVPHPEENMSYVSLDEYQKKICVVKSPSEVLELFERTIVYSNYSTCNNEATV